MNNTGQRNLVLSLFPGIGILDRGFEEEGFTVVRGPDLLWGGDVRRFSVPDGFFEHSPFTLQGKMKMLGNAVPLPMAVAVAKAVKNSFRSEA